MIIDKPIPWSMVRSLLGCGVPRDVAALMVELRVVDRKIAFFEEISGDVVLWNLENGELSSMLGHAFALGEKNIGDQATYVFDNYLHIHADPLEWLKDQGRGIVVLRWDLAFEWLRHAPRIAVDEDVLPQYREHMRPRRLPEPAVLTGRRFAA